MEVGILIWRGGVLFCLGRVWLNFYKKKSFWAQ